MSKNVWHPGWRVKKVNFNMPGDLLQWLARILDPESKLRQLVRLRGWSDYKWKIWTCILRACITGSNIITVSLTGRIYLDSVKNEVNTMITHMLEESEKLLTDSLSSRWSIYSLWHACRGILKSTSYWQIDG